MSAAGVTDGNCFDIIQTTTSGNERTAEGAVLLHGRFLRTNCRFLTKVDPFRASQRRQIEIVAPAIDFPTRFCLA
jgi:hypothetical protein